jgi:hypothetical protein
MQVLLGIQLARAHKCLGYQGMHLWQGNLRCSVDKQSTDGYLPLS